MNLETIDLYQYFGIEKPDNAGGILTCYTHEISEEYNFNTYRPAMLVLPGGGYEFCSDREAEPIAIEFFAKGFNSFVLDYSTKNTSKVEYPYQLIEGCMAIAFIRENFERFRVNIEKVCAVGFSAGGHLCAMLATLTGEKVVGDFLKEKASLCRPDAVILSYPVITWGEFANVPTYDNLCGDREDLKDYLSLQNRVDKNSVPAYIWTTYEDTCVPCENSLYMALAYRKAGVPFELHIFESGEHGASLANKEVKFPVPAIAVWTDLANTWLKDRGFSIIEKENK